MDKALNEKLKLKKEKYRKGAGKSVITRQSYFSSAEEALVCFFS